MKPKYIQCLSIAALLFTALVSTASAKVDFRVFSEKEGKIEFNYSWNEWVKKIDGLHNKTLAKRNNFESVDMYKARQRTAVQKYQNFKSHNWRIRIEQPQSKADYKTGVLIVDVKTEQKLIESGAKEDSKDIRLAVTLSTKELRAIESTPSGLYLTSSIEISSPNEFIISNLELWYYKKKLLNR